LRFLVDSDWVVDYLVGRLAAIDLIRELAPQGIGISLITYGEVFEGIYYGRDPQGTEAALLGFLEGARVVPLTEAIMRRFALIRGGLRRQGMIISDTDMLIAATALEHGSILATRNVRDYARIPGLQLLPS